ncbi:MAG: hypothetical protein JKY37_16120 [Nannocystaceae bacterium]|nr:hypothetical protein [Nannocystaceae bacterium]
MPTAIQRLVFAIGMSSIAACDPTPEQAEIVLPSVDPRRCKPVPGTTGSPNTIEEAVALANGLPFPVTAECFVEALDRPLRIEATESQASVQPAVGARSPRVFVWSTDALVMAIAIDGPGRNLVEFGQFVSPRRSVKAELEFPLSAPASTAAALQRVRNVEYPRITRCFVCHDSERDESTIPGGRSSLVIRPRPSTLVDIVSLVEQHERCDPKTEPARCRWLEAIASHGPIEHRPFDASLPLF